MSTISRRDFMKTAGVMTLAVAASAALAGCSTEGASSSEAPVVETPKASEATFTSSNGEKVTMSATAYNYFADSSDTSVKKCQVVVTMTYTPRAVAAAVVNPTEFYDINFTAVEKNAMTLGDEIVYPVTSKFEPNVNNDVIFNKACEGGNGDVVKVLCKKDAVSTTKYVVFNVDGTASAKVTDINVLVTYRNTSYESNVSLKSIPVVTISK